jgi:polysaccharide deacetylase 2 family uncharacterized protein YibQ
MFKQAINVFIFFCIATFSVGLFSANSFSPSLTSPLNLTPPNTTQPETIKKQKNISISLHKLPTLTIIIDDLGNNLASGRRAVNLPGAITYAILPHTPQARELANYVDQANTSNRFEINKEVIIHMPMEAVGHKSIGPGGLKMQQDQQDFIYTLRAAIQALPQAKGLSNHMGSQLTSQPDRMNWLMSELSKSQFYFIDSKTTGNSAAMQAADQQQIPYLVRDVFLDHDPSPAAIDKAYKKALALANRSGAAVLIAHPYSTTLDYLERELPKLGHAGVALVNASQAIAQKQYRQQYHQQPRQTASLLLSNAMPKNIHTRPAVTALKPKPSEPRFEK